MNRFIEFYPLIKQQKYQLQISKQNSSIAVRTLRQTINSKYFLEMLFSADQKIKAFYINV